MRRDGIIAVDWKDVYYSDHERTNGTRCYVGFIVTDLGCLGIEVRDAVDFGRGIESKRMPKRVYVPGGFEALREKFGVMVRGYGLLTRTIRPQTEGRVIKYKGYIIKDNGYIMDPETHRINMGWRYRVKLDEPWGMEFMVPTLRLAKDNINEDIERRKRL